MANELIVTNAVALAALVDKSTGDTLTAAEYTTLKDSLQEANTATRAANVVFSGPTTGSAAAPTFRALVAADIPSLSAVYQPVDATLTALAALGAGPGFLQVTAQDTFSIAALSGAQVNTALGYTAADNAALAGLQPLDSTLTALGALAQFGAPLQIIRTNAAGTAYEHVDPAGGISGLTAGVIPVATSGTAIGNSKLTMSGTSLGTATLYDDAATVGLTSLVLRQGLGQAGANVFSILKQNEDLLFGISDLEGGQVGFNGTAGVGAAAVFAGSYNLSSGQGRFEPGLLLIGAAGNIFIGEAGIARAAEGVIKFTDGYGTGLGSARALAFGVETANGAIANVKSISESITLSTGGLTTDSTADLLPANSIILSVVARITTTITTTTDWALGDTTTAARFAAANATLTAGTTAVGLAHQQGGVATDAAGPVQIAAAKLRITCSGANPGAGAVRVTVTYLELTPPTS